MRKGIETSMLFWIIVFLIGLVIFIGIALWFKGYGLGVIFSLPSMIPMGLAGEGRKRLRKRKGLSLTMNAVWFLLAVIFIIIVLAISQTLFGGLMK